MKSAEIAQHAREQMAMLTGLQPDTISKLIKDGNTWLIAIEMIELKRIPSSGDVLATYEAMFDNEGNLLSYQRTQRYQRGQIKH